MDSEGAAPHRREDPTPLDACLAQLSRTLDAQVNLARLYMNMQSAPSSIFKWEATEGAMERLAAAVQSFERDLHSAEKLGIGGRWFSEITDQDKAADSAPLASGVGPGWTPVFLPAKRDLDDDVTLDGEATGSRALIASIKEKRSSGMTRSSARPSNATVGTTMCTIKDLDANCESDDEEFSASSPRKADGGDREQEFTPRMTEKNTNESCWHSACPGDVINPQWAGRLSWDLIVILFVLMDAIVLPFQIAYKNGEDPDSFDNTWLVLTTTVFAIDMVLNFNTAYEAGKSDGVPPGTLITSRGRIAMHYFRGWFSIDVMSTIPWGLVAEMLTGGGQGSSTQVAKLTKVVKFVRFLRLMRMLRLAKLGTIWDRIEVHLGSLLLMQTVALVRVIMGIVAICHWNACIFWMVGLPKSVFTEILSDDIQREYAAAPHWTTIQRRYGPEEDLVWTWLEKSRAEAYVFCFYWTLGVMRTMPAEVQPVNLPERIFVLVFMFFALSAFAITVAQITQAFFKFSERRRIFNEEFAAVRMHMRNIGATESLQNKVKSYLRHLFAKRKIQAKEKVLLDALPPALKKRLHFQAKMVHLRKLDVMQGLPKQMLIPVSELAESCDLMPGEVLCRAGAPVRYAYVVVTGRLQELDEAIPLGESASIGSSLPARKSWLQRNTALQVDLVDQDCLLSGDMEISKKTVVVVESAEVLRIDRAKFQAFLQSQHHGSCAFEESDTGGMVRRGSTEAEREKNSQLKHQGAQHAPATMAVSS